MGKGLREKRITSIADSTPVEKRNGMYFKRDGIFCPFPDIGVSCGKGRQCLSLVKDNLKAIRSRHNSTIATACSVHSPQGVIVAGVANPSS